MKKKRLARLERSGFDVFVPAGLDIAQVQTSDEADLLEKYAELHKKGVLTDEEFIAKKKQILEL